MHKNTLLFIILALFAGFVGGFWLANSLNRSAINTAAPQTSSAASNANSPQIKGELDLTDEEINAKIAEADKNAGNFGFQKELGTALYHYSAMKQDFNLLTEAARILNRANSLKSKDLDVLTALGHAHFDIGFAKKDAAEYQKAREIYTDALEIKPGDADISTDLGLTYFLQEPPSYDKAAAQLQKVIDANPKHTRSLQFIVRVLIKQNKLPEAEKALEKLRSIDPNYNVIPELTSELSAARGGGQ
ncbi:MAG: tetratricopeptide repeat protein [Chloracidobacterium sp.]|nr:tetratricopeptide repeat protein [Chloracidobacterium sp.]